MAADGATVHVTLRETIASATQRLDASQVWLDGPVAARPAPSGQRRCPEHHGRSWTIGIFRPGHKRGHPAGPAVLGMDDVGSQPLQQPGNRREPLPSAFDRTSTGSSLVPGRSAARGGRPEDDHLGAAECRPASSLARLVVRSTGPPRSWVSSKATFRAAHRTPRARLFTALSGPRMFSPPAIAAKKVASEKFSTKLRGIRSAPVAKANAASRDGWSQLTCSRRPRRRPAPGRWSARSGKRKRSRAWPEILEVLFTAPDLAFQLTGTARSQIRVGTAVCADRHAAVVHLQQLAARHIPRFTQEAARSIEHRRQTVAVQRARGHGCGYQPRRHRRSRSRGERQVPRQ